MGSDQVAILAHGGPSSLTQPGAFALEIDPPALVLAVVAATGYAWGVRVLHRRGRRWPVARSIWWAAAVIVVTYATQAGPAAHDSVLFSAHVVQHLLLGMVVGAFAALGAPITLAVQATPRAVQTRLVRALHSGPARLVTHPVVAWGLFTATMYLLYFSPLYEWSLRSDVLHAAVHVHFVLAGFIFFAVALGADPLPRRLSPPARLVMVLATVPFHAFLGIALTTGDVPLAVGWYESVPRPAGWATPMEDQRLGGALMWGVGELLTLFAAAVIMVQWVRQDAREQVRTDRRLDAAADRRTRAAAAAATVVGAGVVSSCANNGLPGPVTSQGEEVSSLWAVFLWLAIAVAGLIWVLTAYVVISSIRRRRAAGADAVPRQRQYNTRLELVYTAIPLVIVGALFWATLGVTAALDDVSDEPDLTVEVVGFQWQWQFRYPEQHLVPGGDIVISGQPGPEGNPELVLPVGARIRFVLRADDVIHSFWVPEFLDKRDLIPGVTESPSNVIEVDVISEGHWVGRCAEYCGLDHWRMTFSVRAVPPAVFDDWARASRARSQPIIAGDAEVPGTTATTNPVSGA